MKIMQSNCVCVADSRNEDAKFAIRSVRSCEVRIRPNVSYQAMHTSCTKRREQVGSRLAVGWWWSFPKLWPEKKLRNKYILKILKITLDTNVMMILLNDAHCGQAYSYCWLLFCQKLKEIKKERERKINPIVCKDL